MKYCPNCGKEIPEGADICLGCGKTISNANNSGAKSKLTAGLLGIFLGGWGVHSFYLGHTGKGIGQIVVTLVTCGIGAFWGFIEGILILTGNINTDADGNPLKD